MGKGLTPHNKIVIMAAMTETTLWRIEFYQDERGRRPVEEWISGLDVTERTRIRRTVDLLSTYGIQLTMPYARHLRGTVWELRIAAKRRDYRVLYAAVIGRRFILLHGFSKETAKTPAGELEMAERRLADFIARSKET